MALITPILLDASAFGAYFLFGGLALFTAAVMAAYMPETRGRSLESIQEAFQRPAAASDVARYLRRLVPGGLRRRVAAQARPTAPAGQEFELQPQDRAVPLEATAVSLDGAARGLRLDVASA